MSASLIAGCAVAGCGDADDSSRTEPVVPKHTYVSRPDLTPPLIDATLRTAGSIDDIMSDSDPIFLTPTGDGTPLEGLLITKADGEPIWVKNLDRPSYGLRVQTYRDEQVLTWWRGNTHDEHGTGEFVIMNTSYEIIATVTTTGGGADYYAMTLTPAGTALLTRNEVTAADLSEVGGPADGFVLDSVVQEVDVETGDLLFEWSAAEHVPVGQSMAELERGGGTHEDPFDYFHTSSVTVAPGGGLLVSARNTHAVYRIDRDSGDVTWTLGGSASDYDVPDEAYFAGQHDATMLDDDTVLLFDNHVGPQPGSTRGLQLELDHDEGAVRIAQEFTPPQDRKSASGGNVQVRENGNVVVGWGTEPFFSEYTESGDLLFDAEIVGTDATSSYRAYRLPWKGTPTTSPDLVVRDESIGPTAYVSWNGATDVVKWRFVAGPDRASAAAVAVVKRLSFETAVDVPDEPYVAVEALDEEGNVLGKAVASR